MSTYAWLAAPAFAAFILIALLRRTRVAALLADHPNQRSLHVQPRPRIGGLGIMAAALPCIALGGLHLAIVAAMALFLAAISLGDDLRNLPIEVRLPAHLVAASVAWLAFGSHAGTYGWGAATAAIFVTVWMTNLFNFMDGSDGLAGGMALFGFAAYAWAAHQAGRDDLAWSCAATSAAALGFLAHNFPPARVFMGDAGSVPLGFLAAALGIYGIVSGIWPVWFPPLVFAPFVLDATVTILRRLARGERVWTAHREHFYQRLVLSGWSARGLALAAYALMAACASAALWALRQGHDLPYVIIAASAAIHVLLFFAIERSFRASARR